MMSSSRIWKGSARFDLLFSRHAFSGEVERKSLPANAGRQIHRKDFYQFMDGRQSRIKGNDENFLPLQLRMASERRRDRLLTFEKGRPASEGRRLSTLSGDHLALACMIAKHRPRPASERHHFELEAEATAMPVVAESLTWR
jgi:hypothetical protein